MKHLKKFLSLTLAIAMSLSCGIASFASEGTNSNSSVDFEEVGVYTLEEFNSISEINPSATNSSKIYEFSESAWCPALGAYGEKRQAQQSGTLMVVIGAVCNDPAGPHTGEIVNVKITSGIVTLTSFNVPVDGNVHVYRFNGQDNNKINIVKGNNYTTKISGPSNCLRMAIAGYIAAE